MFLKQCPKSEKKRLLKLVELEQKARSLGYSCIAGVDEAGRGPLAGPVVAAACILSDELFFPGINDSKLVPPLKREALYHTLTTHPQVYYGIGISEVSVIDEINILQATLKAMREAVSKLQARPDYLLVDGEKLVTEGGILAEKIVKGDQKSQSIAAASIIAKVVRDKMMQGYHLLFPEYGFNEHKGYGTEKHRAALKRYGPCAIHRKGFAPVAEYFAAIKED